MLLRLARDAQLPGLFAESQMEHGEFRTYPLPGAPVFPLNARMPRQKTRLHSEVVAFALPPDPSSRESPAPSIDPAFHEQANAPPEVLGYVADRTRCRLRYRGEPELRVDPPHGSLESEAP